MFVFADDIGHHILRLRWHSVLVASCNEETPWGMARRPHIARGWVRLVRLASSRHALARYHCLTLTLLFMWRTCWSLAGEESGEFACICRVRSCEIIWRPCRRLCAYSESHGQSLYDAYLRVRFERFEAIVSRSCTWLSIWDLTIRASCQTVSSCSVHQPSPASHGHLPQS